MPLWITDEAPDFTAETSQGTIHFHDWIGQGRTILFFLGYMAGLESEFKKRNCKIIGLNEKADRTVWKF